jgi:hypothetical protein
MRLTALPLILTLTACTQFPELDNAVSPSAQDAEFPELVPVQGLLTQAEPQNGKPEDTINTLNARVAALRNRANRLRGTVVDPNTRKRMKNGVNDS